MKYQNIDRTSELASFLRVDPLDNGVLTVKSKKTAFTPTAGVKARMVAGFARLDTLATYTPTCGEACDTPIKETVEIRFNVLEGGANFAANKAELMRVFGLAIDDMYLLSGLVPAASADFDSAAG